MGVSRTFFATTALALVMPAAIAAPAFAQDASTESEDQAGIQDIIVTAQRREESVQKASISISVLSAETISKAGVSQAQNLAESVPGLQIGQGGAATQIYIRGVGDYGSSAGTNPAVAFNVDGVYVPRPSGIEGNFYDLERVEVLKGPQGTLYGRNATGGAINVITAKPKLGVTEMRGMIEYGNYDRIGADAAVNLPIGDTFALRVAGQVIHRKGYVTYNFDTDIRQSIRAQALWQPSDALSIRVSGDYTHIGGGSPAFVFVPSPDDATIVKPNVSPWTSVTDPVFTNYVNALSVASNRCAPRLPGTPFALLPFSGACPNIVGPGGIPLTQAQLTFGSFGERGKMNNVFWNLSAQLDYDFGFATLTLLPAYRKVNLDYTTYPGGDTLFDVSAAGVPETSKATSFEARLANDSSVLKWVLGAYYFKEDQLAYNAIRSGYNQNVILNQIIGTKAYAAFGQATFSVSDQFRVLGGARYTSDRRRGTFQSPSVNPSLGFFAALAPPPIGAGCVPGPIYPDVLGTAFIGCESPALSGGDTFKKFNWKAGLEYDLSPENMVYATVSTGFKAGSVYAGEAVLGGGAASYQPENLTAYEIGSRNRFLDNTLQLNFEGFYYDYKDHQEPAVVADARGLVTQAIQNVGSGRVYGGAADLVWKFTPNDTLRVGVEYLNSKYDRFSISSPLIVGTPSFLPNGASGCPITNTFTVPGLTLPPTGVGVGTAFGAVLPGLTRGQIVGSQTQNCAGFPFTRAPKWSGIASYNHVFDLGGDGQIEAEGSMQFQSKRYTGTDYLLTSLRPGYATFNASLTYDAPGGNLSLTAYIRNITNEAVFTSTARSFAIVQLNAGSIAPPRTYGARLRFKF